MDVGIGLGFFSPCDFKLPRRNAIATLDMLQRTGAEVVFCQIVKPGQKPLSVPTGVKNVVFESSDAMFYKENLWNIAATHITKPKFLFLDADVRFKQPDWLARTSAALNIFDLIQPFETAEWLNQIGQKTYAKKSALYGIATGAVPFSQTYHPGFGMAMTRAAFGKLGGFYDLCVIGGGDTAFAFALSNTPGAQKVIAERENDKIVMFGAGSYRKYRERALSADLKLGYLDSVTIEHLWHGRIENRQYATRDKYFDNFWPGPNGYEAPVTRRPDGLLIWAVPQPRAIEYFRAREEDIVAYLPRKYIPRQR